MSRAPDDHDLALLEAFRAGDEGALRTLLARFQGLLAHRIRRRLPPGVRRRVSVADVLQETHLAAFEGRSGLAAEDLAGLRSWLLGIADRQARMHARHHADVAARSVHREATRTRRPETGALPAQPARPSQVAVAAETAELARKARAQLPPEHREVLRMVREEGIPLREVATRLDRSYEATRKLYGRAFLRFKRLFEAMRGGDDA